MEFGTIYLIRQFLTKQKNLIEPTSENLQRIAHALAKRALDNGNNPKFNSPFAKSAKRALGIDIIGGKPDDITVLLAVVTSCL